jgi:hypothetical protein
MTSEPQGLFPDELFSPPAGPAKETRSQGAAVEWLIRVLASGRTSRDYSTSTGHAGSSARTSLAFYPSTADVISQPSFKTWPTSVTGSPRGFWTLAISECPSVVVESSLSDVLETPGPHLRRYFLSPKAAAGILRRAARRGRALPDSLRSALEALAAQT